MSATLDATSTPRRLQTTQVRTPVGDVLVRCGEQEFTVTIGPEGRHVVHPSSTAEPRATITGRLPDVLAAVAFGRRPEEISVAGDRPFLWQALHRAEGDESANQSEQ